VTRYEELLALPPRPFGGLLTERHGGPPVPGVLSSIDSVFMLCSHGLMGHVEDELPFRVEQWVAGGARLEQTFSASVDLGQRLQRQFVSDRRSGLC
jgi:hypothetical protein